MNQREMINSIVSKGFSYNEISRQCGSYPEKISAVARGFKLNDGTPQYVNTIVGDELKAMYEQTKHLDENEHKYGKKHDWITIITSLVTRGFSYHHQGEIVGCNSTMLRDVVDKKQRGKVLAPNKRVQPKLLQLFKETNDWPPQPIKKGNVKSHCYFTMVKTIGNWQV